MNSQSPPAGARGARFQALLTLAATCFPIAASAVIWDNSAGTGLWSTASNWDTDVEPSSATPVIFPTPVVGGGAVTLSGAENAASLQFDAAYVLSSGTSLFLPAASSIHVAPGIGATIITPLNITGGLSKTGTGTLLLNGSNTNPGGTIISAGKIRAGNAGALGAAGIATTVNSTTALEVANAITLDRPVTLMNGGTLAGVGAAFYNGTLTIDAAATAVTLATSETATDVFTLSNGANDITGGTAATVIGIGGAGAVRLTQTSNFTGSWNIPTGSRLELANVNSLGATTISNVTLAGGTLAPRINTATNFTTSQANNIVLSASSTILSDRSSASTAVTHTLGNLSMGTHTLTIAPGPNAASATAGIVVGNVTLGGNPTFAVNDLAAVNGKLTTGSLLGGGVARTIVKSGAGDLAVTGGSTDLPSGSTFTASGGGTVELLFPALGADATVNISAAQNPFGTSSLSVTDGSLRFLADGNGVATPQTYVLPVSMTLAGNVVLDPDRRSGSNSAKLFELPGLSVAAGSVIDIAGDNTHGLRLTGGLALQGSATLQGSSLSSKDGVLNLNGGILGSGGTQLTIGGGTSPMNLSVNAASTYGGGTLMSGSNVVLNAASALGTGPLTMSGGTLIVNTDDALNGTITVNGGTLRVNDIDAIDGNPVNVNGGTLDLRANATGTYLTGALTVSGTSTLGLGNNGVGSSQTLTMPALNVSGTTALTVAPLNSYVTNFSAINLAGDLTLSQTGTTRIQSITESGGPRLFIKAGTGTTELEGGSSHSGGTEVTGGTLLVEHAAALGSGVLTIGATSGTGTAIAQFASGLTIANNIVARFGSSGALTLDSPSGGVTWNGGLALQRNFNLDNGSGVSTYAGAISGSGDITKIGAGEIALTNASNSFGSGAAGAVTVSVGTLSVGSDGALGNPANGVTMAGSAQLKISSGFSSARTFTSTGASSGIHVATGQELILTGALAGTGTFTKHGEGIMTMAATVDSAARGAAATKVNAGVLRLLGTGSLSAAGPLSLDGSSAALELLRDANTAFAYPLSSDGIGSILVDRAPGGSGTNGRHSLGPLTMASGTLTVSGSNGYGLSFGPTSISASNTLTNDTSVPLILDSLFGSPGTSTSVTMFFAGSGDIQINGATSEAATTGNYRLNKTGTGTLRLGTSLADFNSLTTVGNGTLDLNGLSYYPVTVTMGGVASVGGSHIITGAGGLLEFTGSGYTFSATGNPAGATITGNVSLGAGVRNFSIGESGGALIDFLLDGPISGSPGAAIQKSGNGQMRMSGAGNTQPGSVTNLAGSLQLAKSSGDAIGTGGLNINAGTVSLILANQINDSAAVAVNSSSTAQLELASKTETVGPITLTQTSASNSSAIKTGVTGTLVLNGDISLNNNSGAAATNARNVLITGSGLLATPATDGTLDLGGVNRTIHCATTTVGVREPQANATIETRIINGGIIKTGARTLYLTNPDNSFAGGIQVQQGSIRPTVSGALGTGPVTFANGAGVSAGLDLSGAASPMTGDFVIGGAGDFELTYAGAIPNALQMTGNFTLQKDLNVNVVNGTTGDVQTATLQLSGTISDGASTFGLIKKGDGVLRLAAGNTYSGPTTIQDGVLKVSGDSSLGDSTAPLTIDGGALWFDYPEATTAVTRNVVFGPNGGGIRGNYGFSKVIEGNVDWGTAPANAIFGNGTVILSGSTSGGATTGLHLGGPLPFAPAASQEFQEGRGVELTLRGTAALPAGNLKITDGACLVLGNGDFTRPVGTGPGQFTLADRHGGGWGAYGADRHVNIGGAGQTLMWPSPGFLLDDNPFTSEQLAPLVLGSFSGTHTLVFENPIDLNPEWSPTASNWGRNLAIDDGTAEIDVRMTGDIFSYDLSAPYTPAGLYITGGSGTVEIAGDLLGQIDFYMDHFGGGVIFSGDNELEETMMLISGNWTFANDQSIGSPFYLYVASEGIIDVTALTVPYTIAPFGDMTVEGQILGDLLATDLDGNGSISGDLVTNSSSRIFPSFYGTLQVGGDYDHVAGAWVDFEINGVVPEEDYNRMRVTGEVNLAGNVFVSDFFNPVVGQSFALILNDGTDPIVGQFAGLPEGALRNLGNGLALRFSYLLNGDGGAVGNDFGVTVVENLNVTDRGITGTGPLAVAPGGAITLSLAATTDGPSDESGPFVNISFPATMNFVSSTPAPSHVGPSLVQIPLPPQAAGSTANIELHFTAPLAAPSAVTMTATYNGAVPDVDGVSPVATVVTAILPGSQLPPLMSVTRSTVDGDLEATIQTIQDVHYLFEGSLELEDWYPIETFYGDGLPRTIDTPVDEPNEYFRFRIIPYDEQPIGTE